VSIEDYEIIIIIIIIIIIDIKN